MRRRTDAVPRGIANAFPIFPAKAENAEIHDVEGRRYLDFAGGIAVLNVGHRHPAVAEAVAAQLAAYWHPCFQVMPYEPYVRLAERLNALAPGAGPKKTIFLTTGAEAVENAVKIARVHTGRSGLIAFGGAFHGRTLFTLAMTGKVAPYKAGFGPLPGQVWHVPYPDAYHHVSPEASLAALESLFKSDVAPDEVAAIVIEPVQGEGGFNVAPPDFLKRLRATCDEHGIVLVADEIQSGFARTGKLFAIEHSGVVPDLITVAKSLAGGLPLSGVIGKAEIMDAPAPGGLGGTYGGNAVACAAALAVLDVIENEGLCERSTQLGSRMLARLRDLAQEPGLSCIGQVRGLGAMVAVELVQEGAGHAPRPDLAKRCSQAALERGLILLTCGLHGNVLRLLVPLTADEALVDEGLELLAEALRAAVKEGR